MENTAKKIQPVMLVIMDGLGVAPASYGNAVSQSKMPNFDYLTKNYPTMTLQASGESVGLPWGEVGNSEVGHMNLGAGKIIWQSLPRIDKSILDGSFFTIPVFLEAIQNAKKNNSSLHLIGLVSNGCVHSSNKHLYALLELAKKQNFNKVYIHAILDGRDVGKDSAKIFIKELQDKIKDIGVGQIVTMAGRYWAMDRDNHWERIERSYKAMVQAESDKKFSNPMQALEDSYTNNVYDEEFAPIVITKNNQPIGKVENNDSVIFFNFRTDRSRELTKAFVLDDFKGFPRKKISNLYFVTMTEYEKGLPVHIAFPPIKINYPLARVISDAGIKQFHTAETEKYAHVTFFFNGGQENPFPGEDRAVVPSPRVPSYAEKPEMSAAGVAEKVVEAINSNKYGFIVVNFANPDMVGHTGNVKAAVKAIETVDKMLGEIIIKTALVKNWVSLILADHGNCEKMINQDGTVNKEHTNNPVPFVIVDQSQKLNSPLDNPPDFTLKTPAGILADVSPTILKIMGINKPKDMTGIALA